MGQNDDIIREPLWRDGLCTVLDSRWDRALHPAVRRETPRPPALVFMRRGSYTRRMGSARVVGDALHTVMYSNGEEAVIEHPFGDQTAGTTIRFRPGAELWSLLEGMGLGGADRGGGTFPVRVCMRAARTESAHRVLLRALRGEECVEVQEAMVHLLASSVADALGAGGPVSSDAPARLAGRAQEFLAAAYAEKVTLHDVAGVAGCSAWHLSRVFGRVVGMPVHQYLTCLRLRHATELLEEGEQSLTRAALACGFSSHSHFTAAFRREFGMTPSRWRAARG